MKDYQNKELALGDYVIFCRPNYRDLTTGRIVKFTPQKIRVIYRRHYGEDNFDVHLIDSGDVVKMDGEDVNVLLLKGQGLPSDLSINQ